MENYRLSPEILENLKLEHRRAKKKTDADRIKAVVLLGSGWAVGDVAEVLMIDENTVRKWFQAWKNGGTTSLRMRSYAVREVFLNCEQKKSVSDGRKNHSFRSKNVRNRLFTFRNVRSLNQIGFMFKNKIVRRKVPKTP